MFSRRGAILTFAALLAGSVTVQARSLSGRYFVVVWAYEGVGPAEAHTFAAFIFKTTPAPVSSSCPIAAVVPRCKI